MNAWKAAQENQANPLIQLIVEDEVFLTYLSKSELEQIMDSTGYLGDAPKRAQDLAQRINASIKSNE
jgi:adenylosuccinate lyase